MEGIYTPWSNGSVSECSGYKCVTHISLLLLCFLPWGLFIAWYCKSLNAYSVLRFLRRPGITIYLLNIILQSSQLPSIYMVLAYTNHTYQITPYPLFYYSVPARDLFYTDLFNFKFRTHCTHNLGTVVILMPCGSPSSLFSSSTNSSIAFSKVSSDTSSKIGYGSGRVYRVGKRLY